MRVSLNGLERLFAARHDTRDFAAGYDSMAGFPLCAFVIADDIPSPSPDDYAKSITLLLRFDIRRC